MMRHSSVLLTILIAYSAYSFGVMIPYSNNTNLYFSAKENISITCSGTDEVTWTTSFTLKKGYSKHRIIAETPYRKILQIKNASLINVGIHECVSKKNRNEFMRIFLYPDKSCYRDNGTHNFATVSISNSGEVREEFYDGDSLTVINGRPMGQSRRPIV
ncbi:uncharacterized protein LOC135846730 [Planococcus citri]|uniref:uncharacterized protein LOC135846730 n=1 Tax=Planococcus citri TaxID=170843 RepID=UPI0031F87C18